MVNLYALKRYKLLNNLISFVDNEISEHIMQNINRHIEKLENPIDQLELLETENEIRWGKNEGYSGAINKIKNLLITNINISEVNEKEVEDYKKLLTSCIDVIRQKLQSMDQHSLIDFMDIFYLNNNFKSINYELRKVYEEIAGIDDSGFGLHNIKYLIRKGTLPKDFLKVSEYEQLLIFNSKLYSKKI